MFMLCACMHHTLTRVSDEIYACETNGAQGGTRSSRDATAASTCADAHAAKTRETGTEAKTHSHNDNERIN